MSLRRSLSERLRADFLAGLGIVLPAGLTVMLVLWAVDFVDEKVLPFLPGWFGEGHVAGLGLLAFLILTTAAGALLKGVAGRGVVRVSEALVAQIPSPARSTSAPSRSSRPPSTRAIPAFGRSACSNTPPAGGGSPSC